MKSFIIYCPHLNRDIRNILQAVPDPCIFTGYQTPRGEDGCLESHKAIVRIAKGRGWSRVFVMEDDCYFTEAFSFNKWLKMGDWAEKNGYSIITGGCTRTWQPRRVSHDLIEVQKFCSAHCMLYLESGYNCVLRATQPFDQTLGKALVAHPFVAIQAPSYSGILQQNVNYVPYYQSHEQYLGYACL